MPTPGPILPAVPFVGLEPACITWGWPGPPWGHALPFAAGGSHVAKGERKLPEDSTDSGLGGWPVTGQSFNTYFFFTQKQIH